jgi:hypothetical protein
MSVHGSSAQQTRFVRAGAFVVAILAVAAALHGIFFGAVVGDEVPGYYCRTFTQYWECERSSDCAGTFGTYCEFPMNVEWCETGDILDCCIPWYYLHCGASYSCATHMKDGGFCGLHAFCADCP